MCVDGYMSMHQIPGQDPGTERLRRRIVFELTPEQLPLLQEAEHRHGSKRAALVAALAAEAEVEEMRAQVSKAEAKATKPTKEAERAAAGHAKTIAKLERELEGAQKALAERQRDLALARDESKTSKESWEADREELLGALSDRETELAELVDRAVDELYCGHCGKWAPPGQWAWKWVKGKGSYAYHRSCGDHAPGLMSAASWLARRHSSVRKSTG